MGLFTSTIAIVNPLYDETQKIVGVFGIIRDITKQAETEQAFKENQERLQDLFDETLDFILAVDPRGRLLYVNRAWQDISGFSLAEAQQLTISTGLQRRRFSLAGYFRRALAGEKVGQIETTFLTKHRKSIHLEVLCQRTHRAG